MTTKDSPLSQLQFQADRISKALKSAASGQHVPGMEAARKKPSVTFAVAMDDKIIKIQMLWSVIKATEEAALSEYIVKQMREAKDDA